MYLSDSHSGFLCLRTELFSSSDRIQSFFKAEAAYRSKVYANFFSMLLGQSFIWEACFTFRDLKHIHTLLLDWHALDF